MKASLVPGLAAGPGQTSLLVVYIIGPESGLTLGEHRPGIPNETYITDTKIQYYMGLAGLAVF